MEKTSKLLGTAFITMVAIFLLAGCDNPAMEPNETEYMYSDLSIEKAVYRFSLMVKDGDTADMFSNVRLSYTAPPGFKILTAFDDELKNFEDKTVTQKETGGGALPEKKKQAAKNGPAGSADPSRYKRPGPGTKCFPFRRNLSRSKRRYWRQ
jgi:hypothetical protein